MLSGKRILVAEDNDFIAYALVQTITDHRGIALGPAQTNIRALALIDQNPDGAILDGNLLDGPITPVVHALCAKSIPLLVFTGLGLPSDLERSHPDILVILKPLPYETVIRAIAERIDGHALPRAGNMPRLGLVPPPQLVIGRFPATESVASDISQNNPAGCPNRGHQRR
ncbi:MAG TPA: hypothetical protein VEK34_06120 [Methylocella sp.]|nr:hypothetical protein [Methylocella sp.]